MGEAAAKYWVATKTDELLGRASGRAEGNHKENFFGDEHGVFCDGESRDGQKRGRQVSGRRTSSAQVGKTVWARGVGS